MRIPGFGDRHIETVLSDYDGTLSCKGKLANAVKTQLIQLSDLVDIHILTADKKARDHFASVPIHMHILSDDDQDLQKRRYLRDFAPDHVAVLGNGNNDRLLFEAVKSGGGLCIAVENGEGCAMDVIMQSHVLIHHATNAIALLLDPDVCSAVLRY